MHRVLPHAHRALGDQHFCDPAGILALDLRQLGVGEPDDDFVLGGDDLEQRDVVGGKGGHDHNALHDEAGKAETKQQTFGYSHLKLSLFARGADRTNRKCKQKPRATSSWSHGAGNGFDIRAFSSEVGTGSHEENASK